MKPARVLLSLCAAVVLAGCNIGLSPPCTSTDECADGLACVDGTCLAPSPDDGGPGGGGGAVGGGGGGGAVGGGGGGGGAVGGGGGGDDGGTGGGGGGDDAGTGGGSPDGGTDGGPTPAKLRATPTGYDFAATLVGDTSAEVSFTVENIGGEPTRPLTAQLSSPAAGFALTDDTCTGALGSGGSCRLAARFTPTDAGATQATVTVSEPADAGVVTSVTLTLAGTGVTGPTLGISPASWDFGPLVLGSSPLQHDFVVRNLSGSPSGPLTTDFTSSQGFLAVNDGCNGSTLAPLASCTVRVGFAPTSAGMKSAALRVSGLPGGVVQAALTGQAQTAAQLTLSPSPGTFSPEVVGATSLPLAFTVTNAGDATATGVAAQLTGGDFAIASNTCAGATLQGGATCEVTVSFTPSQTGARSGTLAVTATGVPQVQAPLQGTGLSPAALVALSSAYGFGNVPTGSATTGTLTFRNTGGVATGAPSVTTPLLAPFSITENLCASAVPPGQTCTVSVRFAPTATATSMDTLTLAANPGGNASTALSGTGIAPGQLSISAAGHSFADTLLGQTAPTFVFTVQNTGAAMTGVPTVTISGAGDTQYGRTTTCTAALAQNATCTVTVTFSPTVRGTHSPQLSVTASPGGTVVASLSGRGIIPAALSIAPGSHAFGQQLTGSVTTQVFTVTNTGDQTSSTISTSAGTGTPFSIAPGDACQGASLSFNTSCQFTVRYQPTSAGTFMGQVSASATTGGSAQANLSGSAITPATLALTAPDGANWGPVLVGTKNPRTFAIANTGQQASGPLAFGVSGADETDFTVSTDPLAGWCQPGQVLPGGDSCQLTVTFQPGSSGTKSVTLGANATPGTAPTLALTGTGQDPATLSGVNLYNFGGVAVGQSATMSWVLSNTGDVPTGAITFTAAAPFSVSGCASGIPAGSSCTATVTFQPTAGGSATGTITASSTSGATATLSLSGNAQWRITLTAPTTSGASLRTSDASLSCGTTCTKLVNHLSSVTVQAVTTNGSGAHFMSWSAPSACGARGTGNACTLAITGHVTFSATFGTAGTNYNLVFVSSTTEPANRGSLGAYDSRCNTLAAAAGINNAAQDAFVAWMSTTSSNMTTRLPATGAGSGAFRRTDGALVALSRAGLLSGAVLSQIDLDEYGKKVPDVTASTWTGTNADGTGNGQDCAGWTSSSGTLNRGRTAGGPGLWTTGTGGHTCDNTGTRIYCFGKTSSTTAALPTVPTGGKIVFVSPAIAIGGAGYSTPDAHCNLTTNKPTGYATRTFVAMVATTTAAAASKVSQGSQYYRPDGLYVGSGLNLQDEQLNSGIWVSNTGAYLVNVYTHTGAASMKSVAGTTNCTNWTSAGGTTQVGRTNSAAADFFDGSGSSNPCNAARPFYCVEP